MRLLGRPSSINVRKVMWTAAEIGIAPDHEVHWATPGAPTDSSEFRSYNPNALVPVWIDDQGTFWESNTICRYLAARHGRDDLLPTAAADRARVEMWMDWSAGDLNAAWRFPFMALVRRDPRFADSAQVERGIAAWNALMEVLDGHLADGRRFVAGDRFTLADVAVGLSAHRWRHTPIARPALPHIDRYVGRLADRPQFAALATADQP